ncbi:hypothetical protein SAMN05216266_1473 [Amycolatopsis marina]|uniref:Uncharacterized protein n=1 Tax=Amycolatopsis marina TaxID=490629 RepID=A0A1I1CPX5_9PSEU|nr:hypothetical protein SAMN05216266_1473 [Amycolatopsis marina]
MTREAKPSTTYKRTGRRLPTRTRAATVGLF